MGGVLRNQLVIVKCQSMFDKHEPLGGGPTLFLSVDFVNILPKTGGGQTLMFTKALTKF